MSTHDDVRELTPQQREVKATAVVLAGLLTTMVPHSTMHYAVVAAERALGDLIREIANVRTHDKGRTVTNGND